MRKRFGEDLAGEMTMKSKTKSLLATCLLLALLVVPCVAQIEEDALVVCREVNENYLWIIGTPGQTEPVDKFFWGLPGHNDQLVVFDDKATAVRPISGQLRWFVKDYGYMWWGMVDSDTAIVLDGRAGAVREHESGDLEWIIRDADGSVYERFWWGKSGDTPIVLNGQAAAVRQEGQWLHWYVRNSGNFWYGNAGDTPVVSNGQAAVVREDGQGLRWYTQGVSGSVLWGNVGDVPVSVPGTGIPIPVTPSVAEVAEIADIQVAVDTAFADIGLPSMVSVTLSTAETMGVGIDWTAAEDVYDPTLVDTQALEGELILPLGLANPDCLKANVNVIVGELQPPVLTKIVGVTTGVPAISGGQRAYIEFRGLDQYGNEIEIDDYLWYYGLDADVWVDGILVYGWDFGPYYDQITIQRPLCEGNNLTIAFWLYPEDMWGYNLDLIEEGPRDLGTLTYIVGKPEARVAKALTLTASDSSVPAGETVEYLATVVDQFNTKMPIGNYGIRWTVEDADGILPDWPENYGAYNEFTPEKAGTYTITAGWNQNLGVQAKKTLVVGAAKLEWLNVLSIPDNTTTAEGINHEDVVLNVTWNEGAVVTENDLVFNVTDWPENATKADIWLRPAGEYPGKTGDLFVVATTRVAGTYKFIASVGDVEAPEVNVTTTLNMTVARVEIEGIGENESTVGSTITKNLTFWNVHDEEILVQESRVEVARSNKRINVTNVIDNDGNLIALDIEGVEEGLAGVSVVESEGARDSVPFTVAPAGKITRVILGDLVSEHEKWAVGDSEAYMPVTFFDQYGNTMNLKAGFGAVLEYVEIYEKDGAAGLYNGGRYNWASEFFVAWATADAEETGYDQYGPADDDDVIAAILLDCCEIENSGTYTLEFVVPDEPTPLATKDFVVEEQRELDSITLSPNSGSIVRDAKTPIITVCGYDQYGMLYSLSGEGLSVNTENVTIGDEAVSGENLTCTLSASKVGTYAVMINVTDTVNATFALKVADVVDAIAWIEIQGKTANVTPSGETFYQPADLTVYPARIVAGAADNQIELTVKAYGTSGDEVGHDMSKLIWAILDDESDCGITVNNGIITIDASESDGELSSFIVRARAENNVEDTLRIWISADEPAGETGYYFASDEDGEEKLNEIVIDEDEPVVSVYIFAKDQYGQPIGIPANDGSLKFSSNHAFFEIDAGDVALTLFGTESGRTTLFARDAVTTTPVCDIPVILTGVFMVPAATPTAEPTVEPTPTGDPTPTPNPENDE